MLMISKATSIQNAVNTANSALENLGWALDALGIFQEISTNASGKASNQASPKGNLKPLESYKHAPRERIDISLLEILSMFAA